LAEAFPFTFASSHHLDLCKNVNIIPPYVKLIERRKVQKE